MTVAFQRLFGILDRWNNNQFAPSLSKPHELTYRSNNENNLAQNNYPNNNVLRNTNDNNNKFSSNRNNSEHSNALPSKK